MEELQIRNLVKVWYSHRARVARDEFSKFVFLWICFNAWLAFESDEYNDRQMINWLKVAPPSSSLLRAAFDDARPSEVFQSQLRALTGLCPIASSRPGQPDVVIESIDDFPSIVEAVYRVRNNLFHGSKSANEARDHKLVKVCSAILEKWIGNLLVRLRT